MLFDSFPNIFDSGLKEFFNYIASEEKKNIDYEVLQDKFWYRLEIFLVFLMSIKICIIFGLIY